MDLKNYIYGHCINPVRVRVYDPVTMRYEFRELPCGKCLHCRNTHVNEWVTRLYAQSKYSKYVYYITLDYAPFDLTSPVARKLAAETAACYHNINVYHSYGMHPLLLQKNHLQDFFKRFRKNYSIPIQYFACGEYGTHANGKGYGRPHFHAIIFSDDPITQDMLESAWTVHGYKIGRVDYHDLVANGSFDENNKLTKYSSRYVFKYVCKYLQKAGFDFESLATIDFHRTLFESMYQVATTEDLFSVAFSTLLGNNSDREKLWLQYIRDYSPFCVCSKRPSIGFAYYRENAERFSSKDFRLFGLPKECVAFPRYYIRKTKESLCPLFAIGKESGNPSSNSRVGYILRTLREIIDYRTSTDYIESCIANPWSANSHKFGGYTLKELSANNSLHMYDRIDKCFYQFNGYDYTIWQKICGIGYTRVCSMSLDSVLDFVAPDYNKYYDSFLVPLRESRVLSEEDLHDTIRVVLGDTPDVEDRFREMVLSAYDDELSLVYKNKLLTQNSKLTL